MGCFCFCRCKTFTVYLRSLLLFVLISPQRYPVLYDQWCNLFVMGPDSYNWGGLCCKSLFCIDVLQCQCKIANVMFGTMIKMHRWIVFILKPRFVLEPMWLCCSCGWLCVYILKKDRYTLWYLLANMGTMDALKQWLGQFQWRGLSPSQPVKIVNCSSIISYHHLFISGKQRPLFCSSKTWGEWSCFAKGHFSSSSAVFAVIDWKSDQYYLWNFSHEIASNHWVG